MERTEDPRFQQCLEIDMADIGGDQPQQIIAGVGIFVACADIAGQLIGAGGFQKLIDRHFRVGIVEIRDHDIRGHFGKAGGMGREIEQTHRPRSALRQDRAGREIFDRRIGERKFAAMRHIGHKQPGKGLGNARDLEDRLVIDRIVIAGLGWAACKKTPSGGIDDADNQPDGIAIGNHPVIDDPLDFGIGREGRLQRCRCRRGLLCRSGGGRSRRRPRGCRGRRQRDRGPP